MSGKYDDIIHLPHPTSRKHPRMSAHDRAAQFSPFSPLTGLEEKLDETARLTEQKLELDDYAKAVLDGRLQRLLSQIAEKPSVHLLYFKADEHKDGGSYREIVTTVRKIDLYHRCLVLDNEEIIPIDDLYELDFEASSAVSE